MGAIPNKLPGFQDVEDPVLRGRVEEIWGRSIPPEKGWHLTQMFEACHAKMLRGLYVIGENPADSEADINHAREGLARLDFMVVEDIFMTTTAEMADVVLPAAADWAESEGTVTSASLHRGRGGGGSGRLSVIVSVACIQSGRVSGGVLSASSTRSAGSSLVDFHSRIAS